jgi:hypothetical protein
LTGREQLRVDVLIKLRLLTGVLFGLVPAWRASRTDLTLALKNTCSSFAGYSHSKFSESLVVAQVALSLLLLIGAGLFLRAMQDLQHVALGFNAQNLLLFRVDPILSGYQNEQLTNLYQRISERLESVPGVRGVTFSRQRLISGRCGQRKALAGS